MVNNFYIVCNRGKDGVIEFANELRKAITDRGGKCIIASERDKREGAGYTDPKEMPDDIDAVIALGGDGTMIRAAADLSSAGKPILGINFGTVGFLTEIDREHASASLERLFDGDFYIEERMMISGRICRNGTCLYESAGLNDIVLANHDPAHAMAFDFYINGEFLRSYIGSGMIVATPTGSTAYNLSVGGPIVLPDAKLLIATPINPHTLMSRSVILPEDAEAKLVIRRRSGQNASVTVDSSAFTGLIEEDEILIRKADTTAKMIKFKENSYLGILRDKLNTL